MKQIKHVSEQKLILSAKNQHKTGKAAFVSFVIEA